MRNVLLSVALAFSGSEAFAPAGRWVAPGRAASSVPARPPRVAPLRAFLHEQRERPTKNEAPPDAVVPARVMPALAQGTCLVSGFFDDPSRVDQTVFDYLHKVSETTASGGWGDGLGCTRPEDTRLLSACKDSRFWVMGFLGRGA